MRDKQAFAAYVLEKSRLEQKKRLQRRNRMITVGMSLCLCLIISIVFSTVQNQWDGNMEQTPEQLGQNGGGSAGGNASFGNSMYFGDATNGNTSAIEITATHTAKPITPTPSITMTPMLEQTPIDKGPSYGNGTGGGMGEGQPTPPESAPAEFLLDLAFTYNKTNCAIPDKIEVSMNEDTKQIQDVATICKICDWILQGVFTETNGMNGTESEVADYTIQVYYANERITCYLTEGAFFKMAEGAWLETDPAYVAEFITILEGEF